MPKTQRNPVEYVSKVCINFKGGGLQLLHLLLRFIIKDFLSHPVFVHSLQKSKYSSRKRSPINIGTGDNQDVNHLSRTLSRRGGNGDKSDFLTFLGGQ